MIDATLQARAKRRSTWAATLLLAGLLGVMTTGARADTDGRLYGRICASCHYTTFDAKSAVHLPDATNLVRVILFGMNASDSDPLLMMPGFATTLSDADVARIVRYLRRTRTRQAPWPDVEKVVAAVRAEEK